MLPEYDDLIITDHGKDQSGGGKDARFHLPQSQLKNIVRKQKGMIFYDQKEESYIFQYNRSAIVVVIEQETALVVTAYRVHQKKYADNERYVQIS